MIQSAFWNGIDFSGNFNRENSLFNFEAQRVKNILPASDFGTLCFETTSDEFNVLEIIDFTPLFFLSCCCQIRYHQSVHLNVSVSPD